MKKGLAMLLVLCVVAQEGWADNSVVPVIIGGAIADMERKKQKKKQRECKNSEGKSANRQACQGQDSGKAKRN